MSRLFTLRLYIDQSLQSAGQVILLSEQQSHYLLHVMRVSAGEIVATFNGRDGEWLASVQIKGRHQTSLYLIKQNRSQMLTPKLHLFFALLKKDPTDWLITKATELGVSVFHPIITRHTIAERAKIERWQRIVIEAAEQSQRLDIPVIHEPKNLSNIFEEWSVDIPVFCCAEKGDARTFLSLSSALSLDPIKIGSAIIIGPEGGFHQDELDWFKKFPFVYPVNLGPRLLRAETAAITAIANWQLCFGDMVLRPTASLDNPPSIGVL